MAKFTVGKQDYNHKVLVILHDKVRRQSHKPDGSCYVSRRILAPPTLWLQKYISLRAHDFAHSPDSWHQHRLANVACAWSWRLRGINPAIQQFLTQAVSICFSTAGIEMNYGFCKLLAKIGHITETSCLLLVLLHQLGALQLLLLTMET